MRKSWKLRDKFRFSFSAWRGPAILGLAVFLGFPSAVAYSDIATFLSGINRGGERWRTYLTPSPAGSLHEVEMVFTDPITTGALDGGAGMTLPDGGRVALTAESKHQGTPDEDRVTRKLKKGRIVAVTPVTPPKDFSAGSILQRTSSLIGPALDGPEKMVFAKPKIKGKEIEIATAFYRKTPPKPEPGLSPMLAKLVTNDKPDILATAYVRPEPDYARESPFDSILRNDENAGRFIPDIAPDDHALGGNAAAANRLQQGRADLSGRGDLFRGPQRIRQGSGRGGAGHSQSRPQPDLPENDLRRRLPEQGLAQPLPVLLRLRHDPRPDLFAIALEDGQGSRARGDRRQNLAPRSRLGDPLSRHLCESRLGKDDEACRQDRPAHLLQDLWRRLELTAKLPARPCQPPEPRA